MKPAPSGGPRAAVITGSAMEDLFPAERRLTVGTPSGAVEVYRCGGEHADFYFLPRHLRDHSVPPHRIDFRANLQALKELGVERVIATSAVGSISGKLKIGGLGLLDQFIDFSSRRVTVFEEEPVHVDMTHPYDLQLQASILDSARALKVRVTPGLVYICVDGPRYETAAEIRMFAMMGGDVVGMTGATEAIVARELGIRYASIVVATNLAAGLQERVSHDQVVKAMRRAKPVVKRLVTRALEGD